MTEPSARGPTDSAPGRPTPHGAPLRDGYGYPLHRRDDRVLPADWAGPLYVWDIDNTYLISEWSGLRDLIRIRFESAEDKRPVPGAVLLLAALRRHGAHAVRPPVYFVSASPETMRGVLERRMLIDGVVHDGITFRDLGKLRYLRDIFGYKTAALLLYRLSHPGVTGETLFGDDREHDPEVYATYARVCAGELRGDALQALLTERGVRRSAARYIATLAGELPPRDPVEWIVIRRLAPDLPAAPRADDPRLVLVDDFAQAAALFHVLGRVDDDDLRAITASVRQAGRGRAPLGALDALLARPTVAGRLDAQAVQRTRALVASLDPGRVAHPTQESPP